MSAFIIQTGKYRGKRLRLSEPELVVGRDETCRVRLSSEEVSRFHCIVRRSERGWTVRDLGSSNGTYVNNVAIDDEHVLKPGDTVSVGPMILQFTDDAGAAAPAQPAHKPGMSEDDIASWLSDDNVPASIGDTTIITPQDRTPAAGSSPGAQTPPSQASSPAIAPPEPERKFDSIAEEAADIIRRHWELLNEEETGEAESA